MVATVRCDEIANEKFGCITSDTVRSCHFMIMQVLYRF